MTWYRPTLISGCLLGTVSLFLTLFTSHRSSFTTSMSVDVVGTESNDVFHSESVDAESLWQPTSMELVIDSAHFASSRTSDEFVAICVTDKWQTTNKDLVLPITLLAG